MIADMIKKKLNSIVTELFIRGRKLNISLVFVTQSCFKILKDVRLNTTHFFIMKIPNKRELQQIALNHSLDISTKDFINIHKIYTAKSCSFLVNDTTLASDNPLKEYPGQYSVLIEIHIVTGNEQLCKICFQKLFFQNVLAFFYLFYSYHYIRYFIYSDCM